MTAELYNIADFARVFGDGAASAIDEDAMFNDEFDRLQAIRECERRMCLPDLEVVDSIRREGGA